VVYLFVLKRFAYSKCRCTFVKQITTAMTTNLAIVNRGQKFGMLFGVITKNEEIHNVIQKAIKEKRAQKIVDTKYTLSYKIS